MNWPHFLLATLAASIAISLSDWFFTGVLFHDKYRAHPEIWRKREGEGQAIALSTLLGVLTSAAFIFASFEFGIRGFASTFRFAVLCWLIAPLPLLITNAIYIKLHPLVVVSHALGWLARLTIAAIAVAFLPV